MRLILVEDDEKIALFIRNGLKEAGFAVDHIQNGEDGLHMLSNEPYDLAVIDIMLPKLDGLTLIEDVNQQLNLNLNEPYYDTIAGYVMGKLGRIPKLHESIQADGVRIRVEEMNGLRVARVVLTPLESSTQSQESSNNSNDSQH